MTGTNIIFVCVSIALVGVLLIAILVLTKKGTSHLDVEKYRLKWLAIEKNLRADDASSAQLAVLNADKLLDQALRERGVKGETMGERMKAVKDSWTHTDDVWGAHKLRNRIAHESDIHVSHDDARRALKKFKQALKDIGAI